MFFTSFKAAELCVVAEGPFLNLTLNSPVLKYLKFLTDIFVRLLRVKNLKSVLCSELSKILTSFFFLLKSFCSLVFFSLNTFISWNSRPIQEKSVLRTDTLLNLMLVCKRDIFIGKFLRFWFCLLFKTLSNL